ncbi:MAG: hypothetical protein ACLFPR_03365 [Desulfococcaceae bacterium]
MNGRQTAIAPNRPMIVSISADLEADLLEGYFLQMLCFPSALLSSDIKFGMIVHGL